jgi:hypothetical protein
MIDLETKNSTVESLDVLIAELEYIKVLVEDMEDLNEEDSMLEEMQGQVGTIESLYNSLWKLNFATHEEVEKK